MSREALEAYKAGRVTVREFARALGLAVWGALAGRGVAVAQGTTAEIRAALEDALSELT